MIDLRDWYAKPRPDSRFSLSNFLTEEEKAVLKKIKRRVMTFMSMDVEEYERQKEEYVLYVFSIIEDYISENDRDAVKAKVQEYVSEYSITSLNKLLLMSIALKVLSNYLHVNENQDDERTYRLAEELSEQVKETLMFQEYTRIRRVEEKCTIRAKKTKNIRR